MFVSMKTVRCVAISLAFGLFVMCAGCSDFGRPVSGETCYRDGKNDNFRFYGTKTTYSVSVAESAGLFPGLDKFAEQQMAGCEPMVVYFVGRHAIRFPDADDIEQMGKILPKLRDTIVTGQTHRLCQKDVDALKEWKINMVPSDDNNISLTGVDETKAIADRLKKRYPGIFDVAEVSFGVTSKIRTEQTARAFAEVILNGNMTKFKPEVKDFLHYHDICESLLLQQGVVLQKPQIVQQVAKGPEMAAVVRRVGERLGLSEPLSRSTFKAIQRACQFDFALRGSNAAAWCAAFDRTELEFLDHYGDVDDYFEDAYGRRLNQRMSCSLIKDLVKRMKDFVKNKDNDSSEEEEESKRKTKSTTRKESKKAYLHFTHAGVTKKLISAFGLYRQFNPNWNDVCVESRRNRTADVWRSSLVSPFSSNLAFVLHKCPEKERRRKTRDSDDKDDYYLSVWLQEQPVKIDGCEDGLCSMKSFLKQYASVAKKCDLNKICSI